MGFNKKKKGARSYDPLFCTVAQTGQVLDVLHRPGNVHDSNGAVAFVIACLEAVRRELPRVVLEVRMDSAFFSDELVAALTTAGVEFTVSVPFERFQGDHDDSSTIRVRCPSRRIRWRDNAPNMKTAADKPETVM